MRISGMAEVCALPATGRVPVVVDVREDLGKGRQPLTRILQAAKALAVGQDLVLLTTFEPVPLYRVLGLRGFDHEARRLFDGGWEIRFVRRRSRGGKVVSPVVPGTPPPTGRTQAPPGNGVAPPDTQLHWMHLDNRALEPPEPMMRTFAALSALAGGDVLEIHNDRRPMFLYPHLEEHGYLYQTLDEEDGSARVRIWRPAARSGDNGA